MSAVTLPQCPQAPEAAPELTVLLSVHGLEALDGLHESRAARLQASIFNIEWNGDHAPCKPVVPQKNGAAP